MKEQVKFDKIIEVKNVTKVFDDETVLDDINLSIKRGQFVTLLGPSGCGKTTLLRMIAGFIAPTKGEIFIENMPITGVPPYKRPVNTVFQKYALFPHLNVFKNVAYGLKLKKIADREAEAAYVAKETERLNKKWQAEVAAVTEENKKRAAAGEQLLPEPTKEEVVPKAFYRKLTKAEIEEKVNHALELVNLADYGHRDVMSLSGGQQQRIAIARAIVCEPKVLLLDEPLGALDLKMRKEMQIELKSMHKNLGITFIYVTHDQEEALTMSDVIVVMNDGVIQQIGTPKKIYDEPANAFVASFIGESNILSGVMEKDYTISFLGKTVECVDKGFAKNEHVDIVIRPEDIKLYPEGGEKGQFEGVVLSSVFKGTYYEMEIRASDYEFTVQSTKEFKPGQKVRLKIEPDSIHIMKKLRTVNKFSGEMTGSSSVWMCEGEFDTPQTEFEKGAGVNVFVPFDAVELTDDESDGTIGGNVAQSLYKGTYYQVQVYTDTDEDFYIDTTDEWDIGDRVGIKIDPTKITVERAEEENEA